MNELILSLGCVIGAVGTYFAGKALKNKKLRLGKKEMAASKLLWGGLAFLLFASMIPYMFFLNSLSKQLGLNGALFSKGGYVLVGVLDWLTVLTVAISIVSPFFVKKEAKDYCAFVGVAVVIANIAAFRPMVEGNLGVLDLTHWRTYVYMARIVLTAMICGNALLEFILSRDFEGIGKRLGKMGLFIALYLIAFMPTYFPQLLFGEVGDEVQDFSQTHRLFIYVSFILPISIYFAQRHKSEDDKRFCLVMLALSGVIQYFIYHPHRSGAGLFPLHLCNAAIVLMLVAYAFKVKSIYYFTYFINVLGAFIAIVLPNPDDPAFSLGTLTYWYNHWYAFFLPLMGVALGVFERPSFKMMSSSLIVFTCYVVFVFFFNSYLNNPNFGDKYEADYFYLYSDFFIDKAAFVKDLKYNYIWEYTVFGIEMKAFPVFVASIYAVFVALTFAIWGFYTMIFKVSDSHRKLAYRKKLQHVDRLKLLKELDGRPLSAPLNPEGVHMIKIKNFSKTYAGSTKKSVEDLSLEVHDGEVFGFIGHNGAGKSTTIKSLVGIQSITEGSIEVEGYDVARQPLEAKLQMGYVSDNHALYEKLTGREYINYVADLYMVSEEDKKERIEKYVKMFKLEHAIDREIKSYSHGMKQKCMVISALIHNPKVWVLDEPLTGLDPTSSWQIKECMRQHADAGNIVFFSSHVIEVVEKICDRIAIISGGKLRRISTMEELKAEGVSLEQLYLQYAQQHDEEMEDNSLKDNGEA